jgi:hypothetical protein
MSEGFEKFIEEYLSTLNTEYIDSFRDLVSKSIENNFANIDAKYASHKQTKFEDPALEQLNYEWIADDAIFTNDVSYLSDELSIIALYKLFEKKHKELIAYHRKEESAHKYSYWKNALDVLPEAAKSLSNFTAINELRLLNNSIKHEGVVSDDLSKEFPSYGQVGSELSELNKVFERLKPRVKSYINELHNIYKQIT